MLIKVATSKAGRALRLLVLVGVAFIGSYLVGARSARACDVSNHCYASVSGHPATIHGVHNTITPDYIYSCGTSFITNEVWQIDYDATGTYWIEAGFIYIWGVPVDGFTSDGRYLFWGDNRPNHSFHGHIVQSNPSLTQTGFYIQHSSVGTYAVRVHVLNGIDLTAYSTDNSMSTNASESGVEYTSAANTASHGTWTNLEYEPTDTTWAGGPGSPYYVGTDSLSSFTWASEPTSYRAAAGGC